MIKKAELLTAVDALQQIYLDSGWSHLVTLSTEQGRVLNSIHETALKGLLAIPREHRTGTKTSIGSAS